MKNYRNKYLGRRNMTVISSTSVVGLMFIALFSLTACTTMSSIRSSEHSPNTSKTTAAATTLNPVVYAGNTTVFDEKYDETTDQWEKARAAYLRDLDYAKIFQQHNSHDEYMLKSDLIESRYNIKAAETAMEEEKNFPKALSDLQLAEHDYRQAIRLANHREAKDLQATEPYLDDLQESAQMSLHHHHCVYPNSTRYREVEGKIENLLIAL